MDEERVLAADWLARLRVGAFRSQRERLAEGRLMLLWKRRRSHQQVLLVQEEEDEVREDLLVYIQEGDEESRELASSLEDRGAVNFAGFA